MMNRILQSHWVRLLVGNLSVAMLVIGVPAGILLMVSGTHTPETMAVAFLAGLHLAILGIQFSRKGTWIPEKWLAAFFVALPVVDVSLTVRFFNRGLTLHAVYTFLLALVGAFTTVFIVQHQWRRWNDPRETTVTIVQRPQHSAGAPPHDDPTSLVY